ncbi:MAG: right-handed parallel beta-helix repeat-containing protein [Phycisphaerales bacterium]
MATKHALSLVLPSLLLAHASTHASAQTITVTTGEDVVDFGGAQTVTQLPGPDGLISLREAVTAANNTPGPQSIHFAIPRAIWWSLFPNQAGCRLDNAIFLTDNATTIDFTTQTELTGDTNPGGWEVAVFYAGATTFVSQFMVLADDCTIKGMDYVGGNSTGPSVRLYGNNNRIIASTRGIASVAMDPTTPTPVSGNIIGGTSPEDRNDLRRVQFVHGSSGNIVIGNTIRAIQITGDTLYGPCANNRIGGPTPEERNTISGGGSTGEEGFPTGIQVEIKNAVGTVIEGNYIGTTADGFAPWPGTNGTSGINVGLGASGTIIRKNLISGIARTGTFRYAGVRFGTAIIVADGSSNTRIIGNRLGTNADDSATIINVQGLLVARPTTLAAAITGVVIGTDAPGEGNTITGSEQAGVVIHSTVAGVRISANSIFDNGTLGLDLLGALGVTPNDASDGDAGGNNLQNFPVIVAARSGGASTTVEGSLVSTPNQSFELQFFLNPACDPSGYGEGKMYAGSLLVQTGANGQAAFAHTLDTPAPEGSFITATAARVTTGDTSEFSRCEPILPALCAADFNDDGGVDGDDVIAFFGAWDAALVSADINDDGGVDGDDIIAFFGA